MSTCKSCGQPLPIPGRMIFPGAPVQQRLYDVVARRPDLATEDLKYAVWSASDGGPQNRATLGHVIMFVNRRLRPLGMEIRASNRGKDATYRLYHLEHREAAE